MSKHVDLTPSLAKQWIENPALIDHQWQALFAPANKKSAKYHKLLEAVSKGFLLVDSDGEPIGFPIYLKHFRSDVRSICAVVVAMQNPEVKRLQMAIQDAKAAPNFRDHTAFLRNNFIKAASEYLAEMKPEIRTEMSYNQYVAYYQTGVEHSVCSTWVAPDFYQNFPKAGKA